MLKVFISLLLITSSLLFAKINAVVSILPEKTFVRAIGGDKVNVALMVLPGDEPENYEPKPSQMKDIANAQVYFSIGVEFEDVWLSKFTNQNKSMKIVNIASGVKKIAMPSFYNDNKDHDIKKKDPHVWTSPANVKIMAKNIYETLSKIDLENKNYYFVNYKQFIAKVDKIDAKIKKILMNTPKNTKFMVFHPAWGYFAKQYNLVQLPIEIEGKSPKPRELTYIIKKARDERIRAIFTQPEFSDKVAQIIANELGINVVKATPLDENWSKNLLNFARSIVRGR
ncbi:MAG: zinc ABC transporter substrate-binding protein [Sulfurospirillaceae bacterium]|nr:zinc ABC transporter substrate-binding protein [Sulfurospirillaceae bacterium]